MSSSRVFLALVSTVGVGAWECPEGYGGPDQCQDANFDSCDNDDVVLASGDECTSEHAYMSTFNHHQYGTGHMYEGCGDDVCCNCWRVKDASDASPQLQIAGAQSSGSSNLRGANSLYSFSEAPPTFASPTPATLLGSLANASATLSMASSQCLDAVSVAAVDGFDGPWNFQAGLGDQGYRGNGGCTTGEGGCVTCSLRCGSGDAVLSAQLLRAEPVSLSAGDAQALSHITGYTLPGSSPMKGFRATFVWTGAEGHDNGSCPRLATKATMTSYRWSQGSSMLSFVLSQSSWSEAWGPQNSTQREVWTWQYAN